MARRRRGRLSARYAVYFAPEPGDALAEFGAWWLGDRPPAHGVDPQRWRRITASPRRYGFHATLKAPFALAGGADEKALFERAARLAAALGAFHAPALKLGEIDGFLALLPGAPESRLRDLADACVRGLDDLREPPSEAELARRRAAGLTARQDILLERWGYPYVFDEFRFHMTLTERLGPDERRLAAEAIAPRFEAAAGAGLRVDAICLFREPEAGSRFELAARYPLSS